MFFPILVCIAVVLIAVLWAADASQPNLQDASLQVNLSLPSSTSAVTSTGIDTGLRGPNDNFPNNIEFLVLAPSLSTSQLPDGETMSYSLAHSPNPDMSGATIQYPDMIVQTGAGGVGAIAAQARARMPAATPSAPIGRYVGLIATPASGAGNASAAQATLAIVF